MAPKVISSYPPDRWIRTLNQRYPNLWMELRQAHADPTAYTSKIGKDMLAAVPDWCIMPTMFPCLYMSMRNGELFYMTHMDEVMTIASTYIWRCSKGIYRFAPEIYNALITQPLTGDLPMDLLHRLPEWAVYIETPGLSYERIPMHGFIAHLDFNLFSFDTDLQFAMFLEGREMPKTVALPFGGGSIADAMDRVDQVDSFFGNPNVHVRYVGSREEYRKTFSAMLQLLLYLCSEEPDIPTIQHPSARRTFSGTVRSPREPQVWDVGVRVSRFIREYTSSSNASEYRGGSHASPRPHIRSAHWHTFWTGPRKEQFPIRKPVVKWIPPIPVGVDWKSDLPTNIKEVGIGS
ncbi:MAG: hypothetical protein IJK38_05460 [Oscillospiraceae bacterium]|nr:hypothetical protein [Oscillospiraceae bacterium]